MEVRPLEYKRCIVHENMRQSVPASKRLTLKKSIETMNYYVFI